MPFGNLLGEDGRMLPPDRLQAALDTAGVGTAEQLVTSCGSGVTASVLMLGLDQLGRQARCARSAVAHASSTPTRGR